MTTLNRFLKYVTIDTQSKEDETVQPSTSKQFDLAKVLVDELKEIGIKDAVVDAYGYVYGHLEANVDSPCHSVAFISHMDTAPDYTGTNVRPRIIENYDGKDITLKEGVVTRVKDYPYLKKYVGKTLVVTDGNTLLGGDDKAGIAAIMNAIEYLVKHPEIKHGRVGICFTPDEEVGRGTEHISLEKIGADFAYTMDGGSVDGWCDETFNAASCKLSFQGVSIHPGSAKDRMVNALNLANEFHNALPSFMRPEHTSGKEPFFHIVHMAGSSEEASSAYIVRAHAKSDFLMMKEMLENQTKRMNELYGYEAVTLELKDTYYNMYDILKDKPYITRIATEAMKDLGITPVHESVRGGTDGSSLTFMGLPCPNLGIGSQNGHGKYEYVVVEEMELASRVVVKIIENITREGL